MTNTRKAKAKGGVMVNEVAPFEGLDVVAAKVRVTRAGDGLSEAMTLDPQDLHHGEEVYLIIKGKVGRVSYDPVPKADGVLQRVHTVVASECVMVAPDEVEALLDRERDRLARLKEDRAGVARLPLNGDPLGALSDGDAAAAE